MECNIKHFLTLWPIKYFIFLRFLLLVVYNRIRSLPSNGKKTHMLDNQQTVFGTLLFFSPTLNYSNSSFDFFCIYRYIHTYSTRYLIIKCCGSTCTMCLWVWSCQYDLNNSLFLQYFFFHFNLCECFV